jgi:hypothetical protein
VTIPDEGDPQRDHSERDEAAIVPEAHPKAEGDAPAHPGPTDQGVHAAESADGERRSEQEVVEAASAATARAWSNYANHSRSLSDRARHLAFVDIGLIWILSGGGLANVNDVKIDGSYVWPLLLLITALGADLLQYAYLALAWRVRARIKDHQQFTGDYEAAASPTPGSLNRPAEALLAVKVVLVAVGSIWLLVGASDQLLR